MCHVCKLRKQPSAGYKVWRISFVLLPLAFAIAWTSFLTFLLLLGQNQASRVILTQKRQEVRPSVYYWLSSCCDVFNLFLWMNIPWDRLRVQQTTLSSFYISLISIRTVWNKELLIHVEASRRKKKQARLWIGFRVRKRENQTYLSMWRTLTWCKFSWSHPWVEDSYTDGVFMICTCTEQYWENELLRVVVCSGEKERWKKPK